MMPRAMLSVSDKTGSAGFRRALHELGWELLSTGGTARCCASRPAVTDVSEVTGHPEMMDGRVKTLHPAVHAGILARRDRADDMRALRGARLRAIDMVVVNLYPFHEAVAAGSPLPKAMEKVDIGGPTMLRAAAKNHASVLVVVDPADYGRVLDALRPATLTTALRRELARKVFAHTARYDAPSPSTSAELTGGAGGDCELPGASRCELTRVQPLRYGENPDQHAAFYAEAEPPAGSLPQLRQLHGKELSFNNLLDVEAAMSRVSAWADDPVAACVIIKHTTPCGVAVAASAAEAYRRALAATPCRRSAASSPSTRGRRGDRAGTGRHVPRDRGGALLRCGCARCAARKKNLRLIELPVGTPAATNWTSSACAAASSCRTA
jgi:phosphoribosylaminoimidazolecarboxamide formyltransferase / IMP cyclohydrolase